MQYTFSLSRAHKYVSRLHSEYDRNLEAQAEMIAPLIVHVLGDELKAEKQLLKMDLLAETAEKLAGASTAIRVAIAAKNGSIGLHEKLARRAALNRQIESLARLLLQAAHMSGSALEAEQVPAYIQRTAHQTTLPAIRVKVFTEKAQGEMEDKKIRLEREEQRLGDEINDMNQVSIQVDLDPEIAELIGV
jgi:alkylated DNA nucleotide flippase Atl1